ncbi:hypothetical protein OEA41_008074 [Lepraria neglecta]|uniref:Uncharacterized protein n=1 Tax=Lepraria neglecta TaxID=209136 RepID=A0AAD9ZGS4_9LECA|nr:hypothetical protein OEA41_008074 [Lepraria neglecta]
MRRDRKVTTARKVSEADIALAIASIRYNVAPLGENTQPSQWMSLRKYHLFLRLKALIVKPLIRQETAILSSLGLMDSREAPPMELLDLLRKIGVKVDCFQVDIIYEGSEFFTKAYQLRCLQDDVYPFLCILATRMAKGNT